MIDKNEGQMVVINQQAFENLVVWYFQERGLAWPDAQDAVSFLVTEAAELLDAVLRRKNYSRNNERTGRTVPRELADVLIMAMVVAYVEGVDLNAAITEKMRYAITQWKWRQGLIAQAEEDTGVGPVV